MRKGVKTMLSNKIKKPRELPVNNIIEKCLSFIPMKVPSIFQKKHVATGCPQPTRSLQVFQLKLAGTKKS